VTPALACRCKCICHPDLVRIFHLQVLYQIRAAWVGMVTIRCATLAFRRFFGLQVQFGHQTRRMFAIHTPTASFEFCGDTAISIAWKLGADFADFLFQPAFVHELRLIVMAAARCPQDTTHDSLRILPAHLAAQLTLFFRTWGKSVNAFFPGTARQGRCKISISRLCLPARRSSSAIRACCGSVSLAVQSGCIVQKLRLPV